MEISVLVRQGLSIRAIARQMGCSRNTIRRHLKLQAQCQPIVYGPRAERVGKLAPFKAFLRQRAEAARPHWIAEVIATTIHRWSEYSEACTTHIQRRTLHTEIQPDKIPHLLITADQPGHRSIYQQRHVVSHPMWVAQQMGHSDWTMIARVYRWMPHVETNASEKAEQAFSSNDSKKSSCIQQHS